MTTQLYNEGLISKRVSIQHQGENGLNEVDRQRIFLTMTSTFSSVKSKVYIFINECFITVLRFPFRLAQKMNIGLWKICTNSTNAFDSSVFTCCCRSKYMGKGAMARKMKQHQDVLYLKTWNFAIAPKQTPTSFFLIRFAGKAIYKNSYPAWFSLKDDVDQTTCGDLTMLYINDVSVSFIGAKLCSASQPFFHT